MSSVPQHKKIIAAIAPAAIINVVLTILASNTGGEEYQLYATWLPLLRLSALLVFAFYSAFRYEITLANLVIQFGLFLIDIYYALYATRSSHYITLTIISFISLLQLFKVINVGKLLQCEINEKKALPRSKVQAFSCVSGITIATLALLFVESPWMYVLAAEISLYELYILTNGREDDFWSLVAVIASTVVNIIVHLATYMLETKEIVEVFDIEQHSLNNIAIYSMRTLTLLNVFLDAFIVITITPYLKNMCKGKSKRY